MPKIFVFCKTETLAHKKQIVRSYQVKMLGMGLVKLSAAIEGIGQPI